MKKDYDVVIIGAGPAGAIAALALLRRGIQPLIIEQETFPRYQIGESLTGEVGARLRELGLEPLLHAHDFPIKRGVNVWGKDGQNHFFIPVARRDENGELEPAATWQVHRADFDAAVLKHVLDLGADLLPGQARRPLVDGERVVGVEVAGQDESTIRVGSKMLIDCSGRATFLASKSQVTGPVRRGKYDRQLAVFAQVEGALRGEGEHQDDTLIFYREPNHWAWFIPVSSTRVSVGVVTPSDYFKEQAVAKETFFDRELSMINPELTRRVAGVRRATPVRTASNYSYHMQRFVGPGYVCVGDSHRFVDPIFSFGLHFAVHEALTAVAAIVDYFAGDPFDLAPLQRYQAYAERGQDVIQTLLDCFWQYPLPFLIFTHYQYRDQIIDLFSGRIYGDDVDERGAVVAMRRLLARVPEPAGS